ncbi:MAG: hypothetical protein JSS04_22580 [Proteobacteria bacterium]|nr:hypothetical protein [Pseudomonadota bacterium]
MLIVGTNPANEITTNWLDWWNDTTGFDFRAFNQVYDFVRKGVGTRAKLDILRKDHGLRCVEANVYMNERKSGPGPNPEDNLEVIKLLIASMPRLKVVVEHGQIARRRMQGVVLPVRPLPWEHLRNANDIAALAKAIKERCQ